MKKWESIVQHIEQITEKKFLLKQERSLSGGSINAAFLLIGENAQYFVKTNQPGRVVMFEAEAKGLSEIASCHTIRVPESVCFGSDVNQSYIVLEYLDMTGAADQVILGQQLAAMHKVTAKQFGWQIDNTIGNTHQPNTESSSWIDFWREQRLGFQLDLAAKNGYGGELQSLGEHLMIEMPALFTGRNIQPSMLHGDLWGGNVAGLHDGTPVIYDPAFYYGDREADLAMTYLFGGFSDNFYSSYMNAYPVDDGFSVRKNFYNIYHVFNHLNMFGSAYFAQSIALLKQTLSEIR